MINWQFARIRYDWSDRNIGVGDLSWSANEIVRARRSNNGGGYYVTKLDSTKEYFFIYAFITLMSPLELLAMEAE